MEKLKIDDVVTLKDDDKKMVIDKIYNGIDSHEYADCIGVDVFKRYNFKTEILSKC